MNKLTLDETLFFGAHEGATLRELIITTPDYVRWLIVYGKRKLSKEARQFYEQRMAEKQQLNWDAPVNLN